MSGSENHFEDYISDEVLENVILQIKEMHEALPKFLASNPPREVLERLAAIVEEMVEVAEKMRVECEELFKDQNT